MIYLPAGHLALPSVDSSHSRPLAGVRGGQADGSRGRPARWSRCGRDRLPVSFGPAQSGVPDINSMRARDNPRPWTDRCTVSHDPAINDRLRTSAEVFGADWVATDDAGRDPRAA